MGLPESLVIMILRLLKGEIRVKPLHVFLELARSQPFVETIITLGNLKKKLIVVLRYEGWLALLGTHSMPLRLIRTCIVVEGLWGNYLRICKIIH